MDSAETDLLCDGLTLGGAGDGFSSFLNWADDVLDGVTDSAPENYGQQGGSKRCYLRLDMGPSDMLQADCLPVMMEREACPFTEGDVLVAPADCAAPGAQWRPALDTPEHPEYHSGQPDVPDISAKSRRDEYDFYDAPTSSDSGGNPVEMTNDNGRRSARRRTPTTSWPEDNVAPAKRLRREKDDQDYIVPTSRRMLAPSSPTISPAHEAEDAGDADHHGMLSKSSSLRSSETKRSPIGSPVKTELVLDALSGRQDEEDDWKPPSDRSLTERPRPAQRKPAVEIPEGQPVVRAGGVFKTAALNVLRAERRLLSTGEITRVALRLGFLGQLPGKTPEATMASALYTDIKKGKGRNGAGSIFCRPAEGSFGLREWYNDPELAHVLDPTSRGPAPRSQRSASGPTRRGAPTAGQQQLAETAVNSSAQAQVPAPLFMASFTAAAFKSVVNAAGPAGGGGRGIPCTSIPEFNGNKKQGPVAAAAC